MTLFQSKDNFGDCLGGVKAELQKYGKVYKPSEISQMRLPESTGDCDLFLDWSSAWRKRYISCRVENAGSLVSSDGSEIFRYAVTFKEGNKSTRLRGIVMSLIIITIVTSTALLCQCFLSGADFFTGFLRAFVVIIGVTSTLGTAYLWILPCAKARKRVRTLLDIFR